MQVFRVPIPAVLSGAMAVLFDDFDAACGVLWEVELQGQPTSCRLRNRGLLRRPRFQRRHC